MYSILNNSKIPEELNTQEKHFYYSYINHWFKTLNIYQFYLFAYISSITGTPLHSIAYVQKGYVVNNLVDIWY